MNIVSLLPSGTEMVAELGLIDDLVGRTFECDFPPAVKDVEIVVRPIVDQSIDDHGEIDRRIDEALEQEGTIYRVDEQRLCELEPDLIITQDLCEVCAPSDREVSKVLEEMDNPPNVVSMSPATLGEIEENMEELAQRTGTLDRFQEWVTRSKQTFQGIELTVSGRDCPKVLCIEWYDPIYVAGHWVPEQVRRAGGISLLSDPRKPSHVISSEDVVTADPDVLVFMPCGMTTQEALHGADEFLSHEGMGQISAIQNNQVFAVDASSYFARPGPRVIEGTQLLAHLFHGVSMPTAAETKAWKPVAL